MKAYRTYRDRQRGTVIRCSSCYCGGEIREEQRLTPIRKVEKWKIVNCFPKALRANKRWERIG